MFVYIVILFGIAQLTYTGHNPLTDFRSEYYKKSEDYNRNLILSDRSRGENYVYNPPQIEEPAARWEVGVKIIPYQGIQIPEASIKKIQYANAEIRAIKADLDRQLLQIRDMLRSETTVYQRYQIVLHLETLATAFDSYYQRLQRQYQFDNQDLYIAKNLHGVECLREELHNLLNSIMVEFFDKDGVLLAKNPDSLISNLTSRLQLIFHHRTIEKLIARYDRLYENGYIARIPSVDCQRLELIKNHPINKAFDQIDRSLNQGNLDQVDRICKQFELNKKYFRILQKFKASSEHLNEYGMPRIWESHPNWRGYDQQLKTDPDKRDAIMQALQHDHNRAYSLCEHAGIEMPTTAQLNRAHQLYQYHNDPSFLDLASQGLQDEVGFDRVMLLFEQRANTLECIKEVIAQNPDSIILLKEHINDLLSFNYDPQFIPIVKEMVNNPDMISDLKDRLVYRDLYVQNMRKHLECFFFSERAEQIAYQLSEVHSDYQRIEILSSLSIDHIDLNVQEAYQAFYDTKTHLPKLFNYDQQLLKTELPLCLGTQEFTQERKLYAQIMIKPLSSHEQFLQAQQCVCLLSDACMPQETQPVYRDLARTAAQTYLHKGYNTTPADRLQQIELFDRACKAIEQGHITQADIPAQSVKSVQVAESISNQAVHVDYKQLHENVVEKCATHQDGIFADYYQSREQALQQIMAGNGAIYKQTYELCPQAEKILEKNGFDSAQFKTCTGNLLQQDTNAKFVQTLNTLAQKPVLTGATQQIKKGVLECAQAGSQLNQNGNVKEAMIFSDFCHVAVEYLWQGIDASIAVSKGVAEGVYVGVSSEMAALRNSHEETFLTEGSWSEPDLRDRAAMETATIVADLVRLVKDSGEVAFSGVLGVGDAVVGLPELLSNCLEVTKLTGQCIGRITMEVAMIIDAAEREDAATFERHVQTTQQECALVAQSVGEFLGQLKECKHQYNGQITKEDMKELARAGGRFVAEGVILSNGLRGCTKILKGAAQYAQSTEAVLVKLQQVKDISRAQVRNILLSAQLNLASPTFKIPATSAAVEQVVVRDVLTSEVVKVPSFVQIAEDIIERSIIQQGEAPSSSSLVQKVEQYLSLEPKPGYILIPGMEREQKSKSDISTSETTISSERSVIKVSNMKEFFETDFGKMLKCNTVKLNHRYNGQAIYRLEQKVNDTLKKGYHYYLDNLHYDHIEVFDSQGRFVKVLNLDGSINVAKTNAAIGREIRL